MKFPHQRMFFLVHNHTKTPEGGSPVDRACFALETDAENPDQRLEWAAVSHAIVSQADSPCRVSPVFSSARRITAGSSDGLCSI